MAYTVAVYLVDRAYGGPEEGGWYYNCGVPSEEHANFTRGFKRSSDAYAYVRKLNTTYGAKWNKGRHSISSVLSEGEFFAEAYEGNPAPYPASKPHYE
jgi:hypothetical protein